VIYLEGFYGQTVAIEEDRLYDGVEELWLKQREDGLVRIGVTKVGVLLMGGIESTEFFVEVGDRVDLEAEVVFFETFKAVRYVVSPVAGHVTALNRAVEDDPELFDEDPYGDAWLMELHLDEGADLAARFKSPRDYVEALERSEHCAEGSEAILEAKKGSPTCRSVYGGIRGNEPGEGSLSWKEEQEEEPGENPDTGG
jgi:glycine cleavage system H protein